MSGPKSLLICAFFLQGVYMTRERYRRRVYAVMGMQS